MCDGEIVRDRETLVYDRKSLRDEKKKKKMRDEETLCDGETVCLEESGCASRVTEKLRVLRRDWVATRVCVTRRQFRTGRWHKLYAKKSVKV